MRKVIYTALFGDYKLHEPEYIDPEWEYLCFTDRDISSKNWTIVKVKTSDNRKKSREIKINSHNFFEYDVCLYIDAKFKITIKNNINEFSKNLKNDLCLMKHNKRNCIYDEGNFCIQKKKDSKNIILEQLSSYRKEGMPENFGLYAPGIMLKRNTKQINKFMENWFSEVKKYSYRDILSFSYVLWKNPISINVVPFRETYTRFK